MLLSPWSSTLRVDFHKYSSDFVDINEQNFILSCLSSWVDVGNCLLGILESDAGGTSLDSEEEVFYLYQFWAYFSDPFLSSSSVPYHR